MKVLQPVWDLKHGIKTTFYRCETNAFLICLLHQYNTFQAKRREVGYSEEDLKESYGFLLFDDVNKVTHDKNTSFNKS